MGPIRVPKKAVYSNDFGWVETQAYLFCPYVTTTEQMDCPYYSPKSPEQDYPCVHLDGDVCKSTTAKEA